MLRVVWVPALILPALFVFVGTELLRSADKAEIEPLPKIPSSSPEQSRKQFDVRPGFRVELVASEPLIRSPVAMDFDERGRLYVAEFVEYNQYVNPRNKERGAVKLLEDTNGDGVMDKVTVFADNLDSPVAVACWDGGVYVGVVPDLWYLKDTNGDGKADVRRKVLTGFERDRAGEGMLNSFRWTPDNRLLISTSLAGGSLIPSGKPDARPTPIRRQNIHFDPQTETFEPTSGGGQHGMSLNDFGDVFVCDNSNPIQHLNYDGKYLAKNPYVVAPSPVVDINAAGRYPNLHRISPPEPWREARTRLRKDKLVPGSDEGGQAFGFFTGATGVTVYRGDAFPEEFRESIFVGEIANNLVYRAKPEPKGLGWTAVRAEKGREFLASKDVWFRPVQFANGPDGCLYVVDMYRELIEGAAFLPPQVLKHVDVAGGQNLGRIWRIVPENAKLRRTVDLGKLPSEELVKLLEHPNGWHRDTATRLLVQRQEQAVIPALRQLATESEQPVARMLAASTLRSLRGLRSPDVVAGLQDRDARVREHSLRLAEGFGLSAGLAQQLRGMVNDTTPRVRLQLAFTLGSFPGELATELLETLAKSDGVDPLFRLAILCSARERAGILFERLLATEAFRTTAHGKLLLTTLAGQIGAANQSADLVAVAKAVDTLPDSEKAFAAELVKTVIEKLPPAGRTTFTKLTSGRAAKVLAEMLASAKKTASTDTSAVPARVTAIRTLELAPFAEAKPILVANLAANQPGPVQLAALETLARFHETEVPVLVLSKWAGMSPQVRATATETLLARPASVAALLDAVEKGTVRPADLDPARVQVLQKSTDATIRDRATKLFAGVGLSKRADVIAKYEPALSRKGDGVKGKAVFAKQCSACHKLEGVGNAIGPDLASIKNRGLESVLANVLDPNREVLPQYFTYLVTTDDGVTLTGLITAETANTITLRKADGTSATVQRVNIESLKSTGLSAMPEGLEQQIDIPAMADLLAYLSSIK